MSGGTLMVWLRVCSASIGVPAAMRPITGTATGRLPSSSAAGALHGAPAERAFDDARREAAAAVAAAAAASSGSLMTSMARARLGRRRMKPRSSSAVMRRWMPDFERRSSASFISSKEGGTPASFSRSLMKRRSSYCLRVSISSIPPVGSVVCSIPRSSGSIAGVPNSHSQTPAVETNHERTLYVRYVFRNHLILGERDCVLSRTRRLQGVIPASRRISQAEPSAAAGANGGRITSARAAARFPSSERVLVVRPAWRSSAPSLAQLRGGREDSLRAGRWRRRSRPSSAVSCA